MRTRRTLFAIGLCALALVGGAVVQQQAGGHAEVFRAEVDWPAPFDDPRVLVAHVDNVFFGSVVAVAGHESADPRLPRTQYRAVVVESLKGGLSGEVVLTQLGGIRVDTGELLLVEQDELLVPGSTYLFATTTQSNGWQSVVNEFGDVKADSLTERARLRATFVDAVRNPVHYVPPAR